MNASEYSYVNSSPFHTSKYLWPVVIEEVQRSSNTQVFDLGCGNGAFAQKLSSLGFSVTGVDPSGSGIGISNSQTSLARLEIGDCYEDLQERFGKFPVVVSLEVVEHIYYPRRFASCISNLLTDDGIAIVSTPYHSYWKNVMLAITGKMDSHFTALWDNGHIKFWSIKTLSQLLSEQGLVLERVHRVGRIPALAKSMILVFRKPVGAS